MTSDTLPRFEALIEHHHDEIHAYLWRLLGSGADGDRAADAQDLTQEVFLRAYQAYERLRPNSNPRAWLYKIATNCAYTFLKRSQRRARRDVPLLDETDYASGESDLSPERQLVQGEALDALQAAVAALPAKQRAALALRYLQGLGYAEVGEALGCSEDSARANVYQAIRRLRRETGGQ